MPRISGQVLVYCAIGAVLTLVGLNSIRGESSQHTPPASAAAGRDGGSGDFAIGGGDRRLVVDVAGAVRSPGVYRFSQGARVIDAIARAGGPTGNALVGGINRAATLSDGQQVVVPAAPTPGAGVSGSAVATGSADTPVSLGTATQEQLEEIDGIGPVTAEKIIEFRETSGGLGSVEDLDQVSGIGPVTMESLRSALAP